MASPSSSSSSSSSSLASASASSAAASGDSLDVDVRLEQQGLTLRTLSRSFPSHEVLLEKQREWQQQQQQQEQQQQQQKKTPNGKTKGKKQNNKQNATHHTDTTNSALPSPLSYSADVARQMREERSVVAARKFRAGEVVMRSQPYAVVLHPELNTSRCSLCFEASPNLLRCGACKLVCYCCKAHQKLGWWDHKRECRAFTTPNTPLRDLSAAALCDFLLICRVLRRRHAQLIREGALERQRRQGTLTSADAFVVTSSSDGGGGGARGGDDDDDDDDDDRTIKSARVWYDDVARLQSHVEGVAMTDRHKMEGNLLLADLAVDNGLVDLLPNPSPPFLTGESMRMEIIKLLCQFQCNNFARVSPLIVSEGAGVYPLGALLNHACDANCVITYEGATHTQVIRCTRDIDIGEELCHHYTETAATTEERRNVLLRSYFFLCQCRRCEADDVCARAKAQGIVDTDVDVIDRYYAGLNACVAAVRDHGSDDDNADDCLVRKREGELEEAKRLHATADAEEDEMKERQGLFAALRLRWHWLQPYHISILTTLSAMFQVTLVQQDWLSTIAYGRLIARIYDYYYASAPHPLVGSHYYTMGSLYTTLLQQATATSTTTSSSSTTTTSSLMTENSDGSSSSSSSSSGSITFTSSSGGDDCNDTLVEWEKSYLCDTAAAADDDAGSSSLMEQVAWWRRDHTTTTTTTTTTDAATTTTTSDAATSTPMLLTTTLSTLRNTSTSDTLASPRTIATTAAAYLYVAAVVLQRTHGTRCNFYRDLDALRRSVNEQQLQQQQPQQPH